MNYLYYSDIMNRIEQKKWPTYFEPKPAPWFPDEDERCVEVPWAMSRYQGQRRVLEIGLSLADLSLVYAQIKLRELIGCELHGLDIVDIDRVLNRFDRLGIAIRDYYRFHQSDARNTGFETNTFDLVFLISTLEHFGFDEYEPDENAGTVFRRPREYQGHFPDYEACQEDRIALLEIGRILTPNGSLLLSVPLGGRGICALKDSKGLWALYKEYTSREWASLLKDSGLQVIEERFFHLDGGIGWVEEKDPESLCAQEGAVCDPVKGVACVELKKR